MYSSARSQYLHQAHNTTDFNEFSLTGHVVSRDTTLSQSETSEESQQPMGALYLYCLGGGSHVSCE